MTPLSEAAQAEREADAIWARVNAARETLSRDRSGFTPLIAPGMTGEAARAGDLRRRAALLRVNASEISSPSSAAVRAFPHGAAETHESAPKMSTSPSAAPSLPPHASGAAETAEAIAARICASDKVIGAASENAEVEAIAVRIAGADLAAEDDPLEAVVRRIREA